MSNPNIYKYGEKTQFKKSDRPKTKKVYALRLYKEDKERLMNISSKYRSDFMRNAITKALDEYEQKSTNN